MKSLLRMNAVKPTIFMLGLVLAATTPFGAYGQGAAISDAAELEKWVKSLGGKMIRDRNKVGLPPMHVDLSRSKVKDADLAKVATFKSIDSVWLSETDISDAGVKHLTALAELKTLELT